VTVIGSVTFGQCKLLVELGMPAQVNTSLVQVETLIVQVGLKTSSGGYVPLHNTKLVGRNRFVITCSGMSRRRMVPHVEKMSDKSC